MCESSKIHGSYKRDRKVWKMKKALVIASLLLSSSSALAAGRTYCMRSSGGGQLCGNFQIAEINWFGTGIKTYELCGQPVSTKICASGLKFASPGESLAKGNLPVSFYANGGLWR